VSPRHAAAPVDRARGRGWDLPLALWLVAGALVRLLVAFPVYRFYADADSSLTALHALRILDGAPVVFFNGYRLGAAGCWVAAGLFGLVGPTDEALAATPLLFELGALVVGALFVREMLGAERARYALPLVALPPPAVTFWTGMPVAYAEVLFACALCLWAAARMARRGPTPARAALLGLALGFALWTSLLALCAALPVLLWTWPRRRELGRRAALVALAAFALGSAPWWAVNVREGFPSLRQNFAARAVDTPEGARANLDYTVGTRLPELLASTRALEALVPARAARRAGATLMLAIWGAAAACALLDLARRRGPHAPDAAAARAAAALALGVAAAVLAANVFSAAGARRPGEDTVRYLLPIALVLPLLAAGLVRGAGRWRRAGIAGLALLVAWSAAGVFWPGHPERRRWAEARRQDRRQAARLLAAGVEALAGSYSHAYPYNFLTRGGVRGVPIEPGLDFLDVGATLPARPVRWALIGRGATDRERLERCGARLLPRGRLEEVGSGRWVWSGGELEPRGPDARGELTRIRAACPELGRKSPPADPERPDG
jgi:hypothetical protein